MYAERLKAAGYPEITTEVADAGPFYYAEDYHQQYLHKNPWGYCGLGGRASAARSGWVQRRRQWRHLRRWQRNAGTGRPAGARRPRPYAHPPATAGRIVTSSPSSTGVSSPSRNRMSSPPT